MYPLGDMELPIHAIAEHWLKHRTDKATACDLVSELLKRFWLGELPLRAPLRPDPWDRATLLATFRHVLPEAEVQQLFAPLEEAVSETGEVVIELPPRARLPEDPCQWTDDGLARAYAALAQWRDETYPRCSRVGITSFLVRRDDFAALCDSQGWPRPGFWFRTPWPSQAARGKTNAILACREWLRRSARSSTTIRTKQAWREEAMRLFPGLTQRGFDRAWAKDAPASWRRSGRRPTT